MSRIQPEAELKTLSLETLPRNAISARDLRVGDLVREFGRLFLVVRVGPTKNRKYLLVSWIFMPSDGIGPGTEYDVSFTFNSEIDLISRTESVDTPAVKEPVTGVFPIVDRNAIVPLAPIRKSAKRQQRRQQSTK